MALQQSVLCSFYRPLIQKMVLTMCVYRHNCSSCSPMVKNGHYCRNGFKRWGTGEHGEPQHTHI